MRTSSLWEVTLGVSLLAFGLVADRALVGQGASARAASAVATGETARLVATSVRAALIEEGVLKGQAAEGISVERLAVPPDPAAVPSGLPYSRHSRSELAELLSSTAPTPNGLPEAVVARLALGETGLVSSDRGAARDVGARLLAGELPVRPEDLPYLARALGVFDETRVRALIERLRKAPDLARTPAAPAFWRALRSDGAVDGWTMDDRRRVRYQLGATSLLGRAGVLGRARLLPTAEVSPADEHVVAVEGVEGLRLAVAEDRSDERQVRALRAALWVAVLTSAAGLLLVRRATAREAQSTVS